MLNYQALYLNMSSSILMIQLFGLIVNDISLISSLDDGNSISINLHPLSAKNPLLLPVDAFTANNALNVEPAMK